jgi:Arc/MetJ-type ribon-helix-helix transcriptional regulator
MFRLSSEEYDRLRKVTECRNYRSFSDMVREAVGFWLAGGISHRDSGLDQRIRDLEQRFTQLSARVEELSRSSSVTP